VETELKDWERHQERRDDNVARRAGEPQVARWNQPAGNINAVSSGPDSVGAVREMKR
jgi:hypothetical protein